MRRWRKLLKFYKWFDAHSEYRGYRNFTSLSTVRNNDNNEMLQNFQRGRFLLLFLPTRRYASAVLALGLCPSVCLCVSLLKATVSLYWNKCTDPAGFWQTCFDRLILFFRNEDICKSGNLSPNVVPNCGLRKKSRPNIDAMPCNSWPTR